MYAEMKHNFIEEHLKLSVEFCDIDHNTASKPSESLRNLDQFDVKIRFFLGIFKTLLKFKIFWLSVHVISLPLSPIH